MTEPTPLQKIYKTLSERYTTTHPLSHAAHLAATTSLPGGNTRTVLHFAPFPLLTTHASGSTLTTADSHTFVDLLGEYTAGLYGHSHPIILSAIRSALDRGLSFGSTHADEHFLASAIKARFESIELLRFTNSGTEANLLALGAARAWTRREGVVVFQGGYHGGVLGGFRVGEQGRGKGVNAPYEFLVCKYNDLDSVESIFAESGGDIAAVLVEPMLGSGGAIPGAAHFLSGLRRLTSEHGALLIFDEVMTSRLHDGRGLQTQLGIAPDLTTLGKYLGGGLSIGVFGGRADVMGLFDPRRKGALAHAGTFNNNVLSMAAGRAGLEEVFTAEAAKRLHARGEALRERLNEVAKGTLVKVTGCGSLLQFWFTRKKVEEILRPGDGENEGVDEEWVDVLHLEMLERGYYMARRGFLAVSLVVTEDQLNGFVEAVKGFIQKYNDLLSSGL